MTPNLEWDETAHAYVLTEESKRFVGVVGSPGARDLSVMPYQEEPRDLPIRFEIETGPDETRAGFVPIVFAGSVTGRDGRAGRLRSHPGFAAALSTPRTSRTTGGSGGDARDRHARIPPSTGRSPGRRSGSTRGWPRTPRWGRGCSPASAPPATASVRASAGSSAATRSGPRSPSTAYGDFASARTALEFLRRVQRADGKVPHEISQSAP